LAEVLWYIVAEYLWLIVGEYLWYIVAECLWYIIGRSVTPDKLFTRLVTNSRTKPQRFNQQLVQLFEAMSEGGVFGVDEIKHFNGHLYENAEIIPLGVEDLAILYDICGLDWAQIEPSILGTLFERSLDPTKRSQLGAHYTSKDDILLIVEPVLMLPLRRRWQDVKEQAEKLAVQINQEKGKARDTLLAKLSTLIMNYNQELATVRVLDPACGSGNFLYIALRQLLDLWKEVTNTAARMGLPMMMPFNTIAPSPEQLHGIELNIYAHQLAQATIWIGYIQWLVENGFGAPPEPILKPLDSIRQMDAILAYDAEGNPYEPNWPEVDVIIGNPPFLGGNKIRSELGDKTTNNLFSLYKNRIPNSSDLVCYWFERARTELINKKVNRTGLLATQAIRGGTNRTVLTRIDEIGNIFWAQSDRDWILDGANVHVSMIAFDNGCEKQTVLDDKHVLKINTDLTHLSDLTLAMPLIENQNLCFRSDEKGGPFDISFDIAKTMLEAKGNPNGRPNSDVIRPYFNSIDIVRNNRNMWIIDFGCDTTIEKASEYELPFENVKRHVKPVRDQVRIERHKNLWWIHRVPGKQMRSAVQKLHRFVVTPSISKYRLFVWLEATTIPDHQLYVFARSDDFFFGVLHSKPHVIWSLKLGTFLEDRPRYTPTTSFETYPFPWSPGKEPVTDSLVQTIANAARELVEKRETWLNLPGASEAELKKRTLTNLYNQNPTWLQLAHQKLDQAVFAAYGWPVDLSDDEILERLLALNLERSKAQ
jgi:type II restriction/modification system DNA methylase subunit YeeA